MSKLSVTGHHKHCHRPSTQKLMTSLLEDPSVTLYVYLYKYIYVYVFYIYFNIFILNKWRRKVKILFWFKGFVWDFHFFHSHFTLKRRKLGQQEKSKFFIFSHWKMGTWVSFHANHLLCGVCVCAYDVHIQA